MRWAGPDGRTVLDQIKEEVKQCASRLIHANEDQLQDDDASRVNDRELVGLCWAGDWGIG